MRSRTAGERGSVTAEFATVVPAVVIVLACCLASVQIAGQQLRLQDAAVDAARALARDDPAAASRVISAVPGSRLTRSVSGDLVCARLEARSTSPVGTVLGLTLIARSGALGGGR
jgi:Flp pilus assembly protein TadG